MEPFLVVATYVDIRSIKPPDDVIALSVDDYGQWRRNIQSHGRMCLALLLPFFSFTFGAQCTVILAVASPERIVFAADSKITHRQTPTTGKKAEWKYGAAIGCKLAWGVDYVVGIAAMYDPRFLAVANEASLSPGTPSDKANILDRLMNTRSLKVVREMKRDDPQVWKQLLSGLAIFEFAVGGFENGAAVVVVRAYSVSPTGTLRILKERHPQTAGRFVVVSLGDPKSKATIFRHVQTTRDWAVNLIVGARSLIQMGIDAAPEMAGPPISILELTPRGIRWIECGQCQCHNQ